MNKDEIKKQIETLEQDLAKLKAELNKPENYAWKPKDNDRVFIVLSTGQIHQVNYSKALKYEIEQDNVRQSFEEAEDEAKYRKIRKQLVDLIAEINAGVVLDWKNYNQSKHYLATNRNNEMFCNSLEITKFLKSDLYCKRNFKDDAIKLIGQEDLEWWLKR